MLLLLLLLSFNRLQFLFQSVGAAVSLSLSLYADCPPPSSLPFFALSILSPVAAGGKIPRQNSYPSPPTATVALFSPLLCSSSKYVS